MAVQSPFGARCAHSSPPAVAERRSERVVGEAEDDVKVRDPFT